ncbi:MAG: hypothetical protein A2Z06_04175 [Candidatus Glassbacteria bacterium RBG_16_58_8]|uniref:Peptidase C-terminal archaeal/bacterial domain-containing protein n=1 Tax=Candidatus Glassbacteria bacterium RBG_16_58_8 TaxID=1817866 RepID=A0A1F5YC13_9BACT|nr:MAG: hypothetical protein A2Z06_04175 [Candidatus Glassbacteria bacterium RBG_16_58_8]
MTGRQILSQGASIFNAFLILVLSGFLTIEQLRAQGDSPPEEIHYGDFLNREINPSYEIDTFFFRGDSGDAIILLVTDHSGEGGGTTVELELRDPYGNLLASSGDDTQVRITYILPADGIYTIYVWEWLGDWIMPYSIDLEKIAPNPVGIEIGFGDSMEEEVSDLGGIDLLTFEGCTGDVVTIIVTDLSGLGGETTIELELWDPAGNLRDSKDGDSQARIDYTLPSDGTYAILIWEWHGDYVLPYAVALQRTQGGGCGLVEGPSLNIILNQHEFTTGETLVISGQFTNGPNPATVEVKAWAELPNGNLLRVPGVPDEMALGPGEDFTQELFRRDFTGSEPTGDYSIGGRLENPITGQDLSLDIENFTFTH